MKQLINGRGMALKVRTTDKKLDSLVTMRGPRPHGRKPPSPTRKGK